MADKTDIAELGRYRLERRIAQGGMGEVWLARSHGAAGWEKDVALKTILPHLAAQPGFVDQFLDEARIATTLTHGNIVPVFEFGHDQDTYFLAMEYVDGWDLRTLLRRIRSKGDAFPEELALYIGTEVCRGLDYAHQRRDANGDISPIIHRDISPSNILCSRDGEVRVVDFGIASARQRLGTTLTGELRGKIAYMSPEQAGGHTVDARSDLFSLAIVLYEAFAGVRPFVGDTDMQVLGNVQQANYTPLRSHRDDLSEETYALIDHALQRDPDARFENASAMQMQMLDILYHRTGPVSARQLAAFCLQYDRRTYDSGSKLGQSFDALLQEQLSALGEPGTPSSATPSSVTPSGSARSDTTPASATPSNATPASSSSGAVSPGAMTSAPAHSSASGTAAPRTQTVAVTPSASRRALDAPAPLTDKEVRRHAKHKRRRRTLLAAIAFVLLLIVLASFAFQMGSRSGSTSPVVRVYTEPQGALIYFNGVSYGRSTLVARPTAGEWLIRAELEGHATEEQSIQFNADKDVDVRFALDERATSASDGAAETDAAVSDSGEATAPAADAEDSSADASAHAETREDDADAQTAGVDIAAEDAPPTTARVRISGLPDNATLYVNGTRARSLTSARMTVGERARIKADAPGYQPLDQYWTPRSASESLRLRLTALPTGTLTVRFIGDVLIGEVFVDDTSHGVNNDAPRAHIELPVGTHDVRVQNTALDLSFAQKVSVREGQDTTLTVDWSSD